MPFRTGWLIFKRDADRHQGDLAELRALLELVGVIPNEEPTPEPGPQPKGHVPTQVTDDGIIWTPYGTPSREVSDAIMAAWPRELWTDAARVSYLESTHWNPHAERNTLDQAGGRCNVPIDTIRGHRIVSEDSVGLFQVNVCVWDYTREQMLDARQNARAGYRIYREQGWGAWQITSETLGLVGG